MKTSTRLRAALTLVLVPALSACDWTWVFRRRVGVAGARDVVWSSENARPRTGPPPAVEPGASALLIYTYSDADLYEIAAREFRAQMSKVEGVTHVFTIQAYTYPRLAEQIARLDVSAENPIARLMVMGAGRPRRTGGLTWTSRAFREAIAPIRGRFRNHARVFFDVGHFVPRDPARARTSLELVRETLGLRRGSIFTFHDDRVASLREAFARSAWREHLNFDALVRKTFSLGLHAALAYLAVQGEWTGVLTTAVLISSLWRADVLDAPLLDVAKALGPWSAYRLDVRGDETEMKTAGLWWFKRKFRGALECAEALFPTAADAADALHLTPRQIGGR